MPDPTSEVPAEQTGGLGCLLRMVWMLAGNAAMGFAGLWIAQNAGRSLFSAADCVYAAGLFAMIVCRYLDIRYFYGTKGTGGPATMSDWRRFAALAIVIALLVWGAAHGIAFGMTK